MEALLAAAWEGLRLVFSWPNILYPLIATLLTMVVAFLPGVGSVTLMALAIPFTVAWEPIPVVLTFGGFVGGATFMGSITAILFNVPGSGPSAATLLDGHPLAQQGQAKTAIGCSAAASALGSTFGIVVLILLVPVMREIVLAFGPPEFLLLTLWGLTTIAAVTRGAAVKGLIAAGIGLLLAFVGQDPRTAEPRYTFALLYLQDGISLIPVLLGLFSVAEMMALGTSGRDTISGKLRPDDLTGNVTEGIAAVFRHVGLFFRSSAIGTLVGMIPAVGGTVASFVAYGHAVQSARDRSRFGHGDIRGVIAPEAAHDAKDAGALVPALAFGIPGSDGTAMLLAAFALHGLVPGRELLTDGLPLVFAVIWSLFLSNWLTSLVGLTLVRPMARVTVLRTGLLTPMVLVLVAVGAFTYRLRVEDIAVACAFGVAGYYMKKYRWPRIPLIIALLLGRAFEMNLHVTIRLAELGRVDLLRRPIALAFLVLIVVNLMLPWLQRPTRGPAHPVP